MRKRTIPRPLVLHTSIEIDADADRVWQVLTDFPRYPEWNPFILAAEGRVEAGAVLRATMRVGKGERVFTPEVVVAEPGRELRWLGKARWGALFAGEHLFRLEPSGTGTRLEHSEAFTGVLVPFLRRTLRTDTLPRFEAMNRALAARAVETS